MKFHILVVDDEKIVANSLKRILEDEHKKVWIASSSEEAKTLLENKPIDVMLLDYKLGGEDGLEFLKKVHQDYPEMPVVMITAYGTIDVAVEAMKSGAYDFIQKKEKPEFIRFTIQRVLENLMLKKEVQTLREMHRSHSRMPEVICVSRRMQELLNFAREYAKTDSTVLITGETGTGKNLLAEFIHNHSRRANRPFIAINCAAIPPQLMESELFGYERGAFTGAHQKGKPGLLEQANSGTLFLDEVGDLSPELQTKLLHVLEKQEFYRLGAVEPTHIDVRIIAATNTNLTERIEQKKFRIDLFYRLNVATLEIPPLRERKEDIIPLAKYFIDFFNERFHKNVTRLSEDAQTFLKSAAWPGNVRELRNYIERAMLLKKDTVIHLKDFWGSLPNSGVLAGSNLSTENGMFSISLSPGKDLNILHEAQKRLIKQALHISEGNISQAARLLGIPRTSLNYYLSRYGLAKPSD